MFQLRRLLCGVFVVALVACATPERVLPGQFIDARLLPDSRFGIITFHRPVAVAAKFNKGSFLGGGPSEPMPTGVVPDRHFVGVYDLTTHNFRILVRKDNTELLQGKGQLTILGMVGSTVLISEYRQLRNYGSARPNTYLLDTITGAFTQIPLEDELAARGAKVIHAFLARADGVLVIDANGLQDSSFPRPDEGRGIWVRYPSGEYVQVSDDAIFRHDRLGDEVVYMPSPYRGRSEMGFDIGTRATREIPSSEDRPRPRQTSGDFLELRDGLVWLRNRASPTPIGPPLAIDTDSMK
jgi:hypothetical protein